jgi:hypothetical protein
MAKYAFPVLAPHRVTRRARSDPEPSERVDGRAGSPAITFGLPASRSLRQT